MTSPATIAINKPNLTSLTGGNMDVDIVKVSSKGQLVLPLSLRKRLKISTGEKLFVVGAAGTIMLRPLKALSPAMKEELRIEQRAIAGLREIEKGNSEKMSKKEFLRRLSKW